MLVQAGDPTWRDVVPHFRQLSSAELAAFAQPYAGGFGVLTRVSPPYLLLASMDVTQTC